MSQGSCDRMMQMTRRPQDLVSLMDIRFYSWRNRVVREFMCWYQTHWDKRTAKGILLKFNSVFNSWICLRGKKNPKQNYNLKAGTMMCPFHRFTQASCVCNSLSLPFLIISLALSRFSFCSNFRFCTKKLELHMDMFWQAICHLLAKQSVPLSSTPHSNTDTSRVENMWHCGLCNTPSHRI